MSFHLFASLGNPRGWNEFQRSLPAQFSIAAGDVGDKKLVIILYDDKNRAALARRRYSRAVDALKLLEYKWNRADILTAIEDDEITEELKQAMDAFNKDLDYGDRNRITELARMQRDRERDDKVYKGRINAAHQKHEADGEDINWEETGDELFLKTLKPWPSKDRSLFRRAMTMRKELGQALAEQEMQYFDEEEIKNLWPNTTVVKVNVDNDRDKFDDKITICIDGKKVITGYSNMAQVKSDENYVEIKLGRDNLDEYQGKLFKLLKNQKPPMDKDIRDNIIRELGNLIDEHTPLQAAKLTTPVDVAVKQRWTHSFEI